MCVRAYHYTQVNNLRESREGTQEELEGDKIGLEVNHLSTVLKHESLKKNLLKCK